MDGVKKTKFTENTEIWKDIEGYEGYYQVSSKGRVRSLTRRVYNYTKPGRILKVHDNGHSYLNVGLSKEGKRNKHAYVHRLVAAAFIEKPEGCTEVNHKDFNKKNNCVENLEWVTDLQNKKHYRESKNYHAGEERRQARVTGKTMRKVIENKDEQEREKDEGIVHEAVLEAKTQHINNVSAQRHDKQKE